MRFGRQHGLEADGDGREATRLRDRLGQEQAVDDAAVRLQKQ